MLQLTMISLTANGKYVAIWQHLPQGMLAEPAGSAQLGHGKVDAGIPQTVLGTHAKYTVWTLESWMVVHVNTTSDKCSLGPLNSWAISVFTAPSSLQAQTEDRMTTTVVGRMHVNLSLVFDS